MLLEEIDNQLAQDVTLYLLTPAPTLSNNRTPSHIRAVVSNDLVVSFPFAPRNTDSPPASRKMTKRTLAVFRSSSTALGFVVGAPFKLSVKSIVKDGSEHPEKLVFTAELEWLSTAPRVPSVVSRLVNLNKHGVTVLLTFKKGNERPAEKIFEVEDDKPKDDNFVVREHINPEGEFIQPPGDNNAGPSKPRAAKVDKPKVKPQVKYDYELVRFEYRLPALPLESFLPKLEGLRSFIGRRGVNLLYRALRWLGCQPPASSFGHTKRGRGNGKERQDDEHEGDSDGTDPSDDFFHRKLRGRKETPLAGIVDYSEPFVTGVKAGIAERWERYEPSIVVGRASVIASVFELGANFFEGVGRFGDSAFGTPIMVLAEAGLRLCGFDPLLESLGEFKRALAMNKAVAAQGRRTQQQRDATYSHSQNTVFTRSTTTTTTIKTDILTGKYKSRSPSSLGQGVRFAEVYSSTINEEPNEENESDGEHTEDGAAGLGVGLPGIYQPSPIGSLNFPVASSSSGPRPSARSIFATPTDSNDAAATPTPTDGGSPVLRHPASLQSLNGTISLYAPIGEVPAAEASDSLAPEASSPERVHSPRPPQSPEHHRRTSSRDRNQTVIPEEDADSSARSPSQTPTEKSSDDDFQDAFSVAPANPLSPKLEPLTPISPVPELDAPDRPTSPPLVGLGPRPQRHRQHSSSSSSGGGNSPGTPFESNRQLPQTPGQKFSQSSPMMRASPGHHSASGSSHGQQLNWQQQQHSWTQPTGLTHGQGYPQFASQPGTPRPFGAYGVNMPGPYAHQPVTVGPGYGQQQFPSTPTTPRMSPTAPTQYGPSPRGSPRGGSPTSSRSSGSSPSSRGGGSQRGSPQNYSPPNQQRPIGNHPGAGSPTHAGDVASGELDGAMGAPAQQQARVKKGKSKKKRGGGSTFAGAGGASGGGGQ